MYDLLESSPSERQESLSAQCLAVILTLSIDSLFDGEVDVQTFN